MKKEYIEPQCEVVNGTLIAMLASSTLHVEDNTEGGEYEGRIGEYNNSWDEEW